MTDAERLIETRCKKALKAADWDGRHAMEAVRQSIHEDAKTREAVAWHCLTAAICASIAKLTRAHRVKVEAWEREKFGKTLRQDERTVVEDTRRKLMDEQLQTANRPLGDSVRPQVNDERKYEHRQAREHINRAKFFGAVVGKLVDDVTRVCETLTEKQLRELWDEAQQRRDRETAEASAVVAARENARTLMLPKKRMFS